MTPPEEPTEALPTRAVPLPADPGATVDLDRTTAFGAPGTVPHPDATVRLAAPDATVQLGSPDATVHLGSPDATVQLGATPQLGGVDRTTPVAGPDRTAYLGAPERTTQFGGTVPGATDRTVSFGAAEAATTHFGPPGATTGAATAGHAGTTGAYRGGVASGTGQPASGGEVRFGPGVPADPPAAPAWPATAPPRRTRPVWRRVVSVLSSLLTLALVVVVGLYLWQRLSPVEVEGVTVAVPQPAGDRCDVTVDVVATVRTNGRAGQLRYQWFRSDAPPGALLTERVGRGQRTATLTLRWTFSGVGATTETATVNIIEPSPVQAGTQVVYHCRRR